MICKPDLIKIMVFFCFFNSKCKTSKRLFEKKRNRSRSFFFFRFLVLQNKKIKNVSVFCKRKIRSFSIKNLIRLFLQKINQKAIEIIFLYSCFGFTKSNKNQNKNEVCKRKKKLKKNNWNRLFWKKNRSWSVSFFGILVL